MQTQYFKSWSNVLGREMECKLYGHAGKPVLFIPCQDGRFYSFEDFHMTDAWAPWINSGRVMVLAVDTLDAETWSNKTGDPAWRSQRHEQWMAYLTQEVVPAFRDMANACNGWEGFPGITAFGCSLGATHAANLFFRFPDLFDGMLALSGIYDAAYGWDGYMDENVYHNSPVHYLADMPSDHPFLEEYRRHKGIICVGQGPWEVPDTTRRLAQLNAEKDLGLWVDFWGYDVEHDWPWWYKQVDYFVPFLLGDR